MDVAANPEEVVDHRYVTQAELREMMAQGSGLSWSPWFRIIAEEFLGAWWAELDTALAPGSKFVDTAMVHRLRTPAEARC